MKLLALVYSASYRGVGPLNTETDPEPSLIIL